MRFPRHLLIALPLLFPLIPTAPSSAAVPAECNERAAGGPKVGYGLTSNQRLICFKVARPAESRTLMIISGLSAPDTRLVGIDVRPATGAIVGLGDAGGIYLLDPSEGRPVLKARTTVSLDGREFGMDFNPTVDRLRVISDTGQNLRINVDTGATTVDAFTKYGTVRAAGLGAAAYTNNDNDASTTTTLYDIDGPGDQLVVQNPPNDGLLTPVGKLGFRGSSVASFDIWTSLKDGKAVANEGFATLDGGASFFSIELKSGEATFIGNFTVPVIGLAFSM